MYKWKSTLLQKRSMKPQVCSTLYNPSHKFCSLGSSVVTHTDICIACFYACPAMQIPQILWINSALLKCTWKVRIFKIIFPVPWKSRFNLQNDNSVICSLGAFKSLKMLSKLLLTYFSTLPLIILIFNFIVQCVAQKWILSLKPF